ncbi:MAG: sigma-70 family RNA polymerase sigma factor [Planctomycetota bacterium]
MKSASTQIALLQALRAPENEVAWADFVERYGELIRGFSRRQGLSAEDQEDVLQDVLVALSNSMRGFEYDSERGRFRGYLKTITLRMIFSRFRQRKRQGAQEPLADWLGAHDDSLEAVWEDEWRQYHLRQAMTYVEQVASDSDVAAFRAYVIENRDAEEVADALGMSIDRVYQAKSKLFKLIRRQVAEQIEEEG